MRFLTWANDPSDPRCELLFKSAKHFGIEVEPIGVGKEYRGGVSKIEWMHEFLKTVNDSDVLCCTDSYDCLYVRNPASQERYLLDSLVYAGERWNKHKDPKSLHWYTKDSLTIYCYPNGGAFIGCAKWVRLLFHLMWRAMTFRPDMIWEQFWLSRYARYARVLVDQCNTFFYCCGGEWRRFQGEVVDGRFRNKRTGTYPYILHAPIPRRSLPIRERVARELGII